MPTFTVSALTSDIHDGEFTAPLKIGCFQYQIPPCKRYSNISYIVKDLNGDLEPHCLSFAFTNLSFDKYKNSNQLKAHFSTLRSDIERIDLDFTQLTNDNRGVVAKVIKAVNHIQNICNYKLTISVTIPVDSSLGIPEVHFNILKSLLAQFINIGVINILVTKSLKMRNTTWPDLIKSVFNNVKKQLYPIMSLNNAFPGRVSKYFGLVLDCDIILDSMSSIKSTVRQILIHGDRKNIHEFELLQIWDLIQAFSAGQLVIKSYPSNGKNINAFLKNNETALQKSTSLPLPGDLLGVLLSEETELPQYGSTVGLERTPTYRTID